MKNNNKKSIINLEKVSGGAGTPILGENGAGINPLYSKNLVRGGRPGIHPVTDKLESRVILNTADQDLTLITETHSIY